MPFKQQMRIALIYSLAVLASTSFGITGTLAVDLRSALHISTQDLGLAYGILYLPFLLGATFIGGAADRLGTRTVLFIGSLLMFAAAISNFRATNLVWLLTDSFVQGVGMASILIAGQAALAKEGSGKTQAIVLSIWATAPFVGLTMGLLLAGMLADTAYWRFCYVIEGVFLLCLGIVAYFFVRPAPAEASVAVHRGGIRSLLHEPKMIRLAVAFVFVTLTTSGSLAVWPLYLSRAHGSSVSVVANLTALTAPISIFGSIVIGIALSRAVSPGKVMLCYVVAAALSTLFLFSALPSLWTVGVAMGVWTFCSGAVTAFTFTMLPRLLSDKNNVGAATGLLHQMGAIGGVFGAPLLFGIASISHPNLIFIIIIAGCWIIFPIIAPIPFVSDKRPLASF